MSLDAVIKIGGGLLGQAGRLDEVLAVIAAIARTSSLLIVPGGGPFANVVRDVDRELGLSDDAAHWMAILAMDQYAHLIASRLTNARLVTDVREIGSALEEQRVPVLAPYRWMREADPLHHSWDVTSDSIAAWIAGQVRASRLVLVKPSGASGADVVDPGFAGVLPTHVKAAIITSDRIDELGRFIAEPVI